MSSSLIGVGIVGLGGFAANHLNQYESLESLCRIRGVISRKESRGSYQDKIEYLTNKNIPVYHSYDEMLASGDIDLLSIPAPIHLHAPLTIRALEDDLHVFCEKPVAGTLSEAQQMIAAQKKAGKILAIGYQHMVSPSIQRIKQICLSRTLGTLKSIKSLLLWPRAQAYYTRNSWAGKIHTQGVPIYDSPAQNTAGHFLQNMLYLAGDRADESAQAVEIHGDNYRGNSIESADTQTLRALTHNHVNLYLAATHLVPVREDVQMELEFSGGKIIWTEQGDSKVYESTGHSLVLREEFGNSGMELPHQVIKNALEAVTHGTPPLCTIHNSWQHSHLVEQLFNSPVKTINSKFLRVANLDGQPIIIAPGIESYLKRLFDHMELISENNRFFSE